LDFFYLFGFKNFRENHPLYPISNWLAVGQSTRSISKSRDTKSEYVTLDNFYKTVISHRDESRYSLLLSCRAHERHLAVAAGQQNGDQTAKRKSGKEIVQKYRSIHF